MLRSIWRSVDRFSLHYFKYIINELQGIKFVNEFNEGVVEDVLQSLVEIVTYGDKHDPSIFECFMEQQGLAEFVRLLKISRNAKIETSVLQYMSILIQNLHNEHAIYYCFSNGYLNSIIVHEYKFNAGDLALYYVSFLRAVTGRLNGDTLCLLVTVQEGAVTSFPLYTEAVRFAHHGEKMIQTAIRSLTLSIYNGMNFLVFCYRVTCSKNGGYNILLQSPFGGAVCDDMVCKFLTTPPVSQYFSDLVLKLREECIHLDTSFCTMGDSNGSGKRKELESGIDKLLDELYYIKDLLGVGKSCLNVMVTKMLLDLLVVPIVIPLMQLGKNTGVNISAASSLYILSCLLQVVDKKEILDCLASLILYPHVAPFGVLGTEAESVDSGQLKSSSVDVNKIEQVLCSSLKSEELDDDKLLEYVLECKLFACHSISGQWDRDQERKGIFSYFFSDHQGLLLASLMFLLVLAERYDLDNYLASVIGFARTKSESDAAAVSIRLDGSILFRCMPQILHALLKILGSGSATPVLIQWHAGWFLLKLTNLLRVTLSHQELHLFNASFHQAREHLLNELNGCWFDCIPDMFRKEWTSCKTALEVSSRKKDPYFILEVVLHKESSDGNGDDVWQRMVDAVKIFVLHLQLKAHISNYCLPNDPSKNLSNFVACPRSLDVSSAKFGSQVPLGSGIPCKIAFSEMGIRDVFMIPVVKGSSGKLLLVEKHPFQSRIGIVLALAPLAGLSLEIDEKHATWLHVHIRDLNPKLLGKRSDFNSSSHEKEARWTLGFSDAVACESACLLIAEETSKQRSFVESLLAPFLHDNYLGEAADS